jgi:hypothetical protein
MLNKQSRQLIHLNISTVSINREKNLTLLKPLWLQYNQNTGKLYTHRPEIVVNGYVQKIDFFVSPKPPKKLCDAYEEKKKRFLNDLVTDFDEAIEQINKKKEKFRYIPDCHKEIYNLHHAGVTKNKDIAKACNKLSSTITRIKQTMDKQYGNWRENKNLLGKPKNDNENENK